MISARTIALVKDRSDIVAVISESVPSLKRVGRTWKTVCPFHKEKTPSFHVNPERGWFHCFGCGEKGSVVDFVMKHDGYTFPEAVRALAERAGIPIEEEDGPNGSFDRDEAARQKKQKDDLYAVNNLAATFFERQLREHALRGYAEAELARRGLTVDQDAVQAFRIGYAPAAWDGLTTFFKQQGISPIAAESVGLLVPRSSGTGHYDRFRHRLMFAVIDAHGRVVAFSGRALATDGPSAAVIADAMGKMDGPPPKYVNSPESPIYTKGQNLFGLHQARQSIRAEEMAVLVEGNFDVVSLHARGLTNVIAPLGTAFTSDQARLLKRYTHTVTVLFDGDAAGRKATRAAREPCREVGLTARVSVLPEGIDPDDFARTRGPEALREVLARAKGMLEHLIDVALDESFAAADAYERVARVDQVKKLLGEEDDPIVRSLAKTYADQLASRLDLKTTDGRGHLLVAGDVFRALEQSMRRAMELAGPKKPMPVADPPQRARAVPKPAGSMQRGEILGALIEYPTLLDDSDVQSCLDLLDGVYAQTVAVLAKSRANAAPETLQEDGVALQKGLDTAAFLAQIPPAIQASASKRLAAPHHDTLEQARASLLENAAQLRKLILEQETEDIAREQHKAAGDWEREIELAREASDRARLSKGLGRTS